MTRRVSKAALLRQIKALQHEIEEIWRFHLLPVKTLKWRGIESVCDTSGFIPICRYAHRYCLHPGEVGYLKGVRYRMDE